MTQRLKLLIVVSLLGNYVQAHPLLGSMQIFNDGPQFDSQGYGICNADENGELNLIKNVVKNGHIVFDVGANIGGWSALVLAQKKLVKIYAFEPIPAIFKQMKKNIIIPTVFFYNLAIDNQVGDKDFIVYADNRGATDWSSFYFRPEIAAHIKETIKVKTQDLDSFCVQHGVDHIDFLKIDTEGNELAVLHGAKNLLQNKAVPVMQFEYGGTYPDAGITLKQVYDLLQGYGYTIFRILPDKLLKVSHWRQALENFTYSNYVAVLENT